MNAKYQFKYTYNDTNLEEFSPVEITFDMPGEVTVNQMLYNFESFMKACGFYFDGHLEVVKEESCDRPDISDELDGTLYEYKGCMSKFDKECGCETTSSPLEEDEWDKICRTTKETAEQKLKEWNEGIAKLDKEVAKNKWVHGMCNPPCKSQYDER